MAIKVGINGFGRIGRVVLRIMIEHPEQFDICGINLRKADLDYMVYMIKYDSVFRQFNGTVEQFARVAVFPVLRQGVQTEEHLPRAIFVVHGCFRVHFVGQAVSLPRRNDAISSSSSCSSQ